MDTDRVTTRPRWLAPLALLVVFAAVFTAAFVGKIESGGGPHESPPGPSILDQARLPSQAPTAGTTRAGSDGLEAIDCGAVDPGLCLGVADAALAGLPAGLPAVRYVSVSNSLLCGSTLDCPPSLLAGADTLGSAVVGFGDGGPDAWMNVIRVAQGGSPGQYEAWVVRWVTPQRQAAFPAPVPQPASLLK